MCQQLVGHGFRETDLFSVFLTQRQKVHHQTISLDEGYVEPGIVTSLKGSVKGKPESLHWKLKHLFYKIIYRMLIQSGDGHVNNRRSRRLLKVSHHLIIDALSPNRIIDFSRTIQGQDPLTTVYFTKAVRSIGEYDRGVENLRCSLAHLRPKRGLTPVEDRCSKSTGFEPFHKANHRSIVEFQRVVLKPPVAVLTAEVAPMSNVDRYGSRLFG